MARQSRFRLRRGPQAMRIRCPSRTSAQMLAQIFSNPDVFLKITPIQGVALFPLSLFPILAHCSHSSSGFALQAALELVFARGDAGSPSRLWLVRLGPFGGASAGFFFTLWSWPVAIGRCTMLGCRFLLPCRLHRHNRLACVLCLSHL